MKYSKETVDKVCKYVALGLTNEKAARCAGISEATYYVWLKEKPEFLESLKKAKDEGEAANLAIIHRAKNKTWQAAAWLLERQNPELYALRQRLEHTGAGGAPIPIAGAFADLSKMSFKDIEKLGDKIDAYLRPSQSKDDDN